MPDRIAWDSPASNDEGPCGCLRDAVRRWKNMDSEDHEALTGVLVEEAVYLGGWGAPRHELLPGHLDELADILKR